MSQPTRIAYLDNLRSFCVLLVIPLHAYYLGFEGQRWIVHLHDSFHMAALFWVSGFFAGPALARLGGAGYWQARSRSLLMPLLVILALSFPTLAMHLWLRDGSMDGYAAALAAVAASGKILLHGWFLAALLVFVALGGALFRLGRSAHVIALAHRIPPQLAGLSVLALAVVPAAAAEWLWVGERGPMGLPLFLYEALRYLWAFALGLACWQHRTLMDWVQRPDPLVLTVAVLAWTLSLVAPPQEPWLHELLIATRRIASALVLIPICLWVFQRIADHETEASRAVSEAGMTIFVTQWAWLYVLMLALPFSALPETAGFWALSLAAAVASFALHHGVVKRSQVAMAWVAGVRRAARPSSS